MDRPYKRLSRQELCDKAKEVGIEYTDREIELFYSRPEDVLGGKGRVELERRINASELSVDAQD